MDISAAPLLRLELRSSADVVAARIPAHSGSGAREALV